jgi:dolichyl-diphosphooligosaccharide--protein glycosyltransferase
VNIWPRSVRFLTLGVVNIHLTLCLTGVFGLLQIIAFAQLIRSHLSSKQFRDLLFVAVISAGILGSAAFIGLTYKGWIAPWTGRFYSLWDTGYAKKYAE